MISVNSWGTAGAYGTSRAALASDKFRTAQLYAPRSNSIVALLRTRSSKTAARRHENRPGNPVGSLFRPGRWRTGGVLRPALVIGPAPTCGVPNADVPLLLPRKSAARCRP